MNKKASILVAVIVAAFISIIVSAQPSSPGLQKVVHFPEMTGSGTTPAPLGLRRDCAAGSNLKWNSSGSGTWDCGADTGFTTAGTGLTSTGVTVNVGSTSGGMIAVAADSIGLNGSGCGTGNVPVWSGTGSGWACGAVSGGGGGGGGSGSGTLSLGLTTVSSGVNLSTLGTIDWFPSVTAGTNGTRNSCQNGACAEKRLGGGLLSVPGLTYIGPNAANFNGAASITFTSTSTDTLNLTALSTTNVSGIIGTGSTTGWGFQFMLPSPGNLIQRVARLYTYQYSDEMTCSAHAQDGTAADTTVAFDSGNGVDASKLWTLTYTTATSSFVILSCYVTVNYGSSPNVAWYAISLGAV